MKAIPKYIIIGNGRLAKHLNYYFSSMDIPYVTWNRNVNLDLLKKLIQNIDIVLLAISDGSIKPFINSNKNLLKNKTVVHFSGALVIEEAFGYHPLMTFSYQLYDLAFYKKILFCIDEDAPEFGSLFPKLPNPCIKIQKNLKPFYHALCVMANNFTSILWQKFYNDMESIFGAKPEYLNVFLERTLSNILNNHNTCLTGPLIRGDMKTVKKNLVSLNSDPFKSVYKGFVETYMKLKK